MAALGTKVKDKISGFSGIVTGRCQYLSGCNQAMVTPQVLADGKPIEPIWIDEQRLDRVDDSMLVLENGNTPGFDRAPSTKL